MAVELHSAHRPIAHAHNFRLLGNFPGENRTGQFPIESGFGWRFSVPLSAANNFRSARSQAKARKLSHLHC